MMVLRSAAQRSQRARRNWGRVRRALGRSSMFIAAGRRRAARNAATMARVRGYAAAYRATRGRAVYRNVINREIGGRRWW